MGEETKYIWIMNRNIICTSYVGVKLSHKSKIGRLGMPKSFYNNGIGVKDNERQSTNEYESISLLRKRDNLMGVRNTYVIMVKMNGMNACLRQ